ncbi:MAG: transaldolase [Solirubrobacterales bacterium]|nr:transaldolase [Solirubrobacterales bacterium]
MGTAPRKLHDAGQSIWLDYITRDIVEDGTLQRYIDELSLTGLTSNPTIFDKALGSGDSYDGQIAELLGEGKRGEELFFELAITDLRGAADLFRPVYDRTDGVDGFVSLEVSPELAYDGERTAEAASRLHGQADRPNLFIKIPGTPEGLPAITESIAAGIPVNVTLLFDAAQYEAQADAYLKGIERRIERGEDPSVASVASIFVSRWDVAVADEVPADLKDRLGSAAAIRAYVAYRRLLDSDRWQRLENEGARPQRLLFASTGTKDPALPKTKYVLELAAPDTVDTMPEETLLALAEGDDIGGVLPADGGDNEELLRRFEDAGVDLDELASRLQSEGAKKFEDSWNDLLEVISGKESAVGAAG